MRHKTVIINTYKTSWTIVLCNLKNHPACVGQCSKSCGDGVKQRVVTCKGGEHCNMREKPEDVAACNTFPCSARVPGAGVVPASGDNGHNRRVGREHASSTSQGTLLNRCLFTQWVNAGNSLCLTILQTDIMDVQFVFCHPSSES